MILTDISGGSKANHLTDRELQKVKKKVFEIFIGRKAMETDWTCVKEGIKNNLN